MPPKRPRAAAEEAEADDQLTKNLRLHAKSTAVASPATQLAPLAAKHTTSYGSPAPVLPIQGQGNYGSDLKAATRDILAAVNRDHKRQKRQHGSAEPEGDPSTTRVTRSSTRASRESSLQPQVRDEAPAIPSESRAGTTEPGAAPGAQPGPSTEPDVPDDAVTRDLNRLQAANEARAQAAAREKAARAAERKERDRQQREERARVRREEHERVQRERQEQRERDRIQKEQEENERHDREEQERLDREEQQRREQEEEARAEREAEEREERERQHREAVERQERERERREAAERAEQARLEREREQAERERRERAAREERQRAEQEAVQRIRQQEMDRVEREEQESRRRQAEQDREAEAAHRAAVAAERQADVNHLLQRSQQRQAREDQDRPPAQHWPRENLLHKIESQLPQKRSGQEFLDEFFSPKKPRNANETPSARLLAQHRRHESETRDLAPPPSTRSFIEESSLYRHANLQTPLPSSVIGDSPSRPAVSGRVASRATSVPPVPTHPNVAQNAQAPPDWRQTLHETFGTPTNPRPQPSQPALVPQQPTRPVAVHEQDDHGNKEAVAAPRAGPSTGPRRSSRLEGKRPDLRPESRKPAPKPPAKPQVDDEPRREDRDSSSDPSESSDDEDKDGPASRKDPDPVQPRRDANSPARGGAPPGDDPSPDDNSLAAQSKKAWNDWKDYLWRILLWLGYSLLVMAASSVLFHLWSRIGSSDWETSRYGVEWYGWSHMGRNIGQFIPYDLRHPLGMLSDEEYNGLRDHIYSQDGRIFKLTAQNDDLRETTEKLSSILPRVVSVKQDKKTSRLVIGQDFWHALKELIHNEKSILTLDRGKDGYNNISDEHWWALLRRLKAEGVLSRKDVDGIVQGAVSSSWETWLKNNRGKVNKVLGSSPGQQLSGDAEKKLLEDVEKLVREKVTGKGLREIVVTREEFIREVERNMAAHKRQADAELAEVQESLRDMIDAARTAAERSRGLSRDEVVSLTNDIVRKAISNARLEGTAKGSISHNFEVELSRQVNYFALGNGATVEAGLSSPAYENPTLKRPWFFGTTQWANTVLRAPRFSKEHTAVLAAWEDAGECWCAGKRFEDSETQPADLAIRVARTIVPENLVVEHIDPGATIDPHAMPRDVEVWAHIDDPKLLDTALDFSYAQWPQAMAAKDRHHPHHGHGSRRHHPLTEMGFVMVGRLTYEHDRATGGVQVYQFPEELARLGIATDTVIVRAVSNYGADHTCFYRIRLYGSEQEGGRVEEIK